MGMEAIQTSKKKKKKSRRVAAKLYKVLESTLRARITSRPYRHDTRPNRHNLTDLKEEMTVRYIFDIDERGFAPRLAGVENLANYILELRERRRVGKLWAYQFIQRRPDLKTRFNRVYDFQRALYKRS